MRKLMLGLAVAAVTLAGTAYAQDKKFTIGVSIPAADHARSLRPRPSRQEG